MSLPMVGMLLMPAVNTFIQAYPEIESDLDFTDHLVDVIGEGFDVVLRTGDAAASCLMTRIVGTFHHRLVASPAYLERYGVPIKPADLAHHGRSRAGYRQPPRFCAAGASPEWPSDPYLSPKLRVFVEFMTANLFPPE